MDDTLAADSVLGDPAAKEEESATPAGPPSHGRADLLIIVDKMQYALH